ncbi:MAG: citrate transporter, partial [Gallionellaceae bacterium]|nr:citrate transporter [Gallionellaceae bacterium]
MALYGIPLEFFLFGLTLLGVASLHHRTFEVALGGLMIIVIYKITTQNLDIVTHLQHEWQLLLNLFGLLLGFAILARHFEDSGLPELLPRWLPQGWAGGFTLLALTWLVSVFLDNIAAAVIGGVIAKQIFNNRVSVSYIAALVASANAGGAGSVIGDTTTTMMWIAGVPAWDVAHAFIAATVALIFSGIIASRFQHRMQPMQIPPGNNEKTLVYTRLGIVIAIIGGLIISNVFLHFPAVGAWVVILLAGLLHPVPWQEAGKALKGSLFLLALVLAASLMPVQALPDPSWHTVFGLGWLSAV